MADSCSTLPLTPTHVHHDRHRRRHQRYLISCLVCLVLVLALILTIVILAFTVFKPRDLTTTVVSPAVSGLSQRVNTVTGRLDYFNVTLDMVLSVRNPNRMTFAYEPTTALLYYRGVQVGDADVAAGRMPARGSEVMKVKLMMEAGKINTDLGSNLIKDAMAGAIGVGTFVRIRGKVTFLGFIKFHVAAMSACEMEVGVSEMKVRSQECKNKAKL